MNAFYYYHRDKNNRPTITRCFVTDGQRHARGTAVCCPKDNPCKSTGRRIAFSRAMAAFHGGDVVWGSNPSGSEQFAKCQPNPAPFPIEEKFIQAVASHE